VASRKRSWEKPLSDIRWAQDQRSAQMEVYFESILFGRVVGFGSADSSDALCPGELNGLRSRRTDRAQRLPLRRSGSLRSPQRSRKSAVLTV